MIPQTTSHTYPNLPGDLAQGRKPAIIEHRPQESIQSLITLRVLSRFSDHAFVRRVSPWPPRRRFRGKGATSACSKNKEAMTITMTMTSQERPWWGTSGLAKVQQKGKARTEERVSSVVKIDSLTLGEIVHDLLPRCEASRAWVAEGEGWPPIVAPSASHVWTQHRTDVVALSRDRTADDALPVQVPKDLSGARLEEQAKKAVADWPPLTHAQVDRLARLLQSGDGLRPPEVIKGVPR